MLGFQGADYTVKQMLCWFRLLSDILLLFSAQVNVTPRRKHS